MYTFVFTHMGMIQIDAEDVELARELASTALSVSLGDVKYGPVVDISEMALSLWEPHPPMKPDIVGYVLDTLHGGSLVYCPLCIGGWLVATGDFPALTRDQAEGIRCDKCHTLLTEGRE